MCFRPPSAEAGESVCPGCFTVVLPDSEGRCPECGADMSSSEPTKPSIPQKPSTPGAPSAPGAPKAPGAPMPPKAARPSDTSE